MKPRIGPLTVWLLLLPLFGSSAASCDRFRDASRAECELAVDHILDLGAREGTGEDHPLVAWLARAGTKGLFRLSGDYEAELRRCVATRSRHQVRCILKAETLHAVKACD